MRLRFSAGACAILPPRCTYVKYHSQKNTGRRRDCRIRPARPAMAFIAPTVGVSSTFPKDMPADHAALPVWNAENWFYEDWPVGQKIRSLRRTMSEGDSHLFNTLVVDIHPYVQDQMFAEREGVFGKRLIAGAFVFSAGLGLVATNCVNAFSYGYDKLRFIKPVFIGDTIYTIRTNLDKRPRYKEHRADPRQLRGVQGRGRARALLRAPADGEVQEPGRLRRQDREIGDARRADSLSGLVVVDLSQFLSGPYCSLRLLDLGARVIKIERPDGGDLSRRLYLSDTEIGGDSTIFHAINRGKESLAIDLKDEADLAALRGLIAKADVLIQNFRPGVIERLGLDYETVQRDQPAARLCLDQRLRRRGAVGEAAGPGPAGAGALRRDVAERRRETRGRCRSASRSATCWPAPRRRKASSRRWSGAASPGKGAHIETSLLEALVDFQFEVLTTYPQRRPPAADALQCPQRPCLSLGALRRLPGEGRLPRHRHDADPEARAAARARGGARALCRRSDDVVHRARRRSRRSSPQRIATKTVDEWLAILEPADIWCAKVLNWPELLANRRLHRARHAADGDARGRRLDRDDALADPHRRRPQPRSTVPRRGSASTAPRSGRSSDYERHAPRHDLEPPARLRPDGRLLGAVEGEDRRRGRLGQALAPGFRIVPGRGTGAELRLHRHRPPACRA